jgi:hypothetical protein
MCRLVHAMCPSVIKIDQYVADSINGGGLSTR